MTKIELISKHKELSDEVQRLSELKNLTDAEEKALIILKKLKLSYKDEIANINSHSACGCNRDCSNCG